MDRPFPNLSGRRHVPKLVNANRIPFLRFKRPQSPFVSRIIRDTAKTRERRSLIAMELDRQIPAALAEDGWDRILFDKFGLKDEGMSWSHEIKLAHKENHSLQAIAIERRINIAARMQQIVDQEKQLAVEERQRIQDEKRQRYKIRREIRRRETIPSIEQGEIPDSISNASHEDVLGMSSNNGENLKTSKATDQVSVENPDFKTDENIEVRQQE